MAGARRSRDRSPRGGGRERRLARGVRGIAFLSRLFEQTCQTAGLSLPQYRLLLYVRRGPQRAAELAARAAVKRPTLTALVDGLQQQGLLRRIPVEGDRRGVRLDLTAKGITALDQAEAALARQLDAIAAVGEQSAILDGLDALATTLEQELEARVRAEPGAGRGEGPVSAPDRRG
jgi:DNA-binding MarR family transcriptional regulator